VTEKSLILLSVFRSLFLPSPALSPRGSRYGSVSAWVRPSVEFDFDSIQNNGGWIYEKNVCRIRVLCVRIWSGYSGTEAYLCWSGASYDYQYQVSGRL